MLPSNSYVKTIFNKGSDNIYFMSSIKKLLLSIPAVLGLFYLLTFWFPSEFSSLFPDMNSYYTQMTLLNVLALIQLTILIRRLWSFKNIPKATKSSWTLLLIIFNSISSLIYIWKMDSRLKNNNTYFQTK